MADTVSASLPLFSKVTLFPAASPVTVPPMVYVGKVLTVYLCTRVNPLEGTVAGQSPAVVGALR